MKKREPYRKRNLSAKDLKIIHALVVRTVKQVDAIHKSDIPDIEHEVVLALARRIAKFDPEIQNWGAFRAIVVYHALTDIVRKYTGPFSEANVIANFTLDDPVPGSFASNLLFYRDLVNFDGVIADGTEKDESERWALIMDVREIVSKMPPDLKRVCMAIMRNGGGRPEDVAGILGISRSTAFRRFQQIKNSFISGGIVG